MKERNKSVCCVWEGEKMKLEEGSICVSQRLYAIAGKVLL